MSAQARDFDVVIVGGGISGICAACHLLKYCPDMSFALLEARDSIGGTWDWFKYPGIRSDSDMHTLGFSFFPWHSDKALSCAEDIMAYLHETISKFKLNKFIKLHHKVMSMDFDSNAATWNLQLQVGANAEPQQLSCQFIHMCTGYYEYDGGYLPGFKGEENFKGKLVHPNAWDSSYDYTDRKVVVIGSGATAITVVPAMAKKTKVTMLQRTPSYLFYVPEKEQSMFYKSRFLPETVASTLTRWSYILGFSFIWWFATTFPKTARKFILGETRKHLPNYTDEEFKKHFHPPYMPWQQRICAVLNGDLFKAIRKGQVEVVTDHIDHFTESGIQLESGAHLEADLVVSATGLNLQKNFPMSYVRVSVDGTPYKAAERFMYRGLICEDVPNLLFTIGYAAASWTLGAEARCRYWVRLLNHMRKNGYSTYNASTLGEIQPSDDAPLPLESGYVQRAKPFMPKMSHTSPWTAGNHFIIDAFKAQTVSLSDKYMQYTLDSNTPTRSRL